MTCLCGFSLALQRFMHFLVTISKWVPTLKSTALLGKFWVLFPKDILQLLLAFNWVLISKSCIVCVCVCVNYVFFEGLSLTKGRKEN